MAVPSNQRQYLRLRHAAAVLSCACIASVSAPLFADPAIPYPGHYHDERDAHAGDAATKHLYVFGDPTPFQGPLLWRYNDSGRPASLTLDQAISGIKGATQKWMDVCKVAITRGADTSALPQSMGGDNTSPGQNVLGWGNLALGANGSSAVAGVTWTYSSSSGDLVEMDMTYSSANVTSTSALARVAVHEWGHALGLGHSNVASAVMSGPVGSYNAGVPDTTYTGLADLADDDKHGCLCLYGPSDAMAGQGYLCGLPPVVAMGTVALGADSAARAVSLRNASTSASLTIASVQFTSAEMRNTGGCPGGTVLGPGQACTLGLVFHSQGSLGARATSFVRVATSNGVGTYAFPVTAVVSAAPVIPASQLVPSTLAFGNVAVGVGVPAHTATFSNVGATSLVVAGLIEGGADAGDFIASGGSCASGVTLAPRASCTLRYAFKPTDTGARFAYVDITSNATTLRLVLYGTGSGGNVSTSPVVEFYNAALDHYFITAVTQEIAVLDTGAIPGWSRTGQTFNTYLTATAGTSPVCRYYIPPAQGNSHFFSVFASECDIIPQRFPTFVFEGANVMYMFMPDATSGTCPVGSVAVYRVWNQRVDSNHRYMVSLALRDQMVARGYVAEGYGPQGVAQCAPQ